MRKRTNDRKLDKCICDNCGVKFEKPLSEIKRNKKLNRKNFCSRTCVGLNNSKNLLNVKNRYDITQHSGNRKSENTGFNYHYRTIKKRSKDFDVTIEDLKEQWEIQNGICHYSGVKLELMSYSKNKPSQIYSASVDRIDSNRGYVKGNIRWVSKPINYMKNTMSDDEVWELCRIIYYNMKKKGS